MVNVKNLHSPDKQAETASRIAKLKGFDDGGGGGYDGGMETRISKLEDFALDTRDRLTRIETRMDHFATKADISDTKAAIAEAKASIIMWVVGAVFLAQLLPVLPEIISAVSKLLGK